MEEVFREDAVSPVAPISQAIKTNGFVVVSGQTGRDPETREMVSDNIGEQTKQIFRNVSAVLNSADSSIDDIIRATVYLPDLSEKPDFNEAYEQCLSEPYPARSVIGGVELASGAKVELEITAEV
jgi:2-iminobutanoate/2-iminopropanoate deaminase